MSLPLLSVIPAGAGSGKTHTIQMRLAQWIADGEVRPERVVAVTFAEAAASELRERIRAELLSRQLPDAALKLEQAAITTIHGFGLRLLTDYCFEAGVSPEPRLLSDDEEDSLIRHALSETDRADDVMDDLSAFGYSYDFLKKRTAEDGFRQRVLSLIKVLRVIGHDEEDAVLLRHARRYLTSTYGECDQAERLERALRSAVEQLLSEFPDDWSLSIFASKAASTDFRKNHRDLQEARVGVSLGSDWKLWHRLRSLRISGQSVHLPDAYKALAESVMVAAEGVLRHPGPREQALSHLDALFGAAHDSLARHALAKREAGLLDYTDMLSTAARVLHSDPTVLEDLVGRVDCVVIDEFQDTNPLQFSLLWALHRAGVPALVVGDRKQAIMRFQHADARLMKTLEVQNRKALEPLEHNWRTRGDLLACMNDVGAGLFGENYQRLQPRADFPSSMQALEVIDLHSMGRSHVAPHHTALRIHALLNDSEQVCFDRRRKCTRRLRGEDIAVLCPTHRHLERYANALRGLGLRVRVQQEGWFASRIVQLAIHALAYVGGEGDRYARLYLAVTELGGHTLESALKCLVDGETIEDALFEKLDRVHAGLPDRSAVTMVDEVIAALDLFAICARWPGGRQSRANLLRLRAEARCFVETQPESLASGGFYGSSLEAFLSWTAGRAERDDDQPEARVVDEDAIHLCTWHKAKGREWPVVAVCGTYEKLAPRLPDIDVEYREFGDLEQILAEARIRYSPSFALPELSERFSDPLMEWVEDDARRMLYVVLTRPREKLILEWPSHLANQQAMTYWSVLRRATGMRLQDGALWVGDRDHEVKITRGGREKPSDYDRLACLGVADHSSASRQSIRRGNLPEATIPEAITPSGLAGDELEDAPSFTTKTVVPALDLDLDLRGFDRGNLLHRCLEIMSGDPGRVELLEEGTGYGFTEEQKQAISMTVERFESWLDEHFAPLALEREVPVLGLNAHGSVIAGAIDLLVETDDGYWILDYKSDRVDDVDAQFGHYLPQLMAYAEALCRRDDKKAVLGVGIYWLMTGATSFSNLD